LQLEELTIEGLFDHFDHRVVFPTSSEEEEDAIPSLVILHGRNGVGKTTILRMIDGLMQLNFDVFREVPFSLCSLLFTTGDRLSVADGRVKRQRVFDVTFETLEEGKQNVTLDGRRGKKGAFREGETPKVEEFRKTFFSKTNSIFFDYIATSRRPEPEEPDSLRAMGYEFRDGVVVQSARAQAQRADQLQPLAAKVAAFVESAQLDYRRFFSTTEPELFPRILQRLSEAAPEEYAPDELARRLNNLRDEGERLSRLGLEMERWDPDVLMVYLEELSSSPNRAYGLAVLAAYAEVLESRAEQRALVANRLLTFEAIMNEFLLDKHVSVDPERGLRIETTGGRVLTENRLSSGEYHLLYLMVEALVTRRRGTVIAIDEPEMSMHIAWQRKLIPNLLRCASNAAPQFIFATHSPDIVADYRSSLIRIGPDEEDNAARS